MMDFVARRPGLLSCGCALLGVVGLASPATGQAGTGGGASSSLQGAADAGHDQWVVREYLPSDYLGQNQLMDWWGTYVPSPDADGNGRLDFVVRGGVIGSSPGEWHLNACLGGRADFDLKAVYRQPPYLGFQIGSTYLLRAGPEIHAVGFDGLSWGIPGDPSLLRFWDWTSGTVLVDLPIPPGPGGGLPDPVAWTGGSPVGDLDGDGFDEIADCTTDANVEYAIAILLDGRTRTVKWMNYMASPTGSMVWWWVPLSPYLDPCADVDGDGVKDIHMAFMSGWSFGELGIRCISGRDGSTIWERWYAGGADSGRSSTYRVGDLNGDGIREIVYSEAATLFMSAPGAIMALDGSDGQILWRRRLIDYDPQFDPGWTGLRFLMGAGKQEIRDMDGDGVSDIAADSRFRKDFHTSAGHTIAVLSGRDGRAISLEPRQLEMDPWAPGLVDYGTNDSHPMGDLDGDGWPEWSVAFRAWQSAAIFGRATLAVPSEAREGELVDASVWIPAGAGKEYQLLLSDGFDNTRASVVQDGWDTHLLSSPVLRVSARNQRLRGTLDADGRARFQFRIPQGHGLAGGPLYAIALVRDPARPDGVLVKSSLGMIEVLP